ncbi:hypothetical protein SAMN04487818_104335 [Actinokineospora terrae]|uniref:Uncharacterized protein n=1 Tax=Actinokineospora terrae TaxID=155974 RepID=A0A1H9QKZ8_9PSEU|nr:hypothetical protein SAMN04487818_104335 [Actinokineospora terrae]
MAISEVSRTPLYPDSGPRRRRVSDGADHPRSEPLWAGLGPGNPLPDRGQPGPDDGGERLRRLYRRQVTDSR